MDIKTLIYILIIVNIILGIFTFAIKQKHYKAIEYWIAINFLVASGLTLIMLRGSLSAFFSIVISNSILFSTIFLRFIGYKKLINSKLTKIEIIIGSLLFISAAVIHTIFSLWYDNHLYRMINYNTYMTITGSVVGIFLIKSQQKNFKKIFILVAVSFFIFAATYLTKNIGLLIMPNYNHFLQINFFNYFPLILQIALDIVWTISLLFIYTEMAMLKQKQSEQRYKTLSDLTYEGIMIHKDGIIVDVNTALCKILGYSPQELIGTNIINKAVASDDISKVQKMIAQESTKIYEANGIRKDGSIFPAELQARHSYFDNEQLRVVAVRDITKRKKQETALKESEERYRILFEQNSIGLATANTKGEILDVNQKFCNMLKYSRNELLTKTFFDITYQEDKKNETELLEKITSGNTNEIVIQKRYITKNNDIIWVYVHSHIIRQTDRKNDYFISSTIDITENINAQQKIIEQNQILTTQETALKTALETKEILLKEIHHRVKNNLQTMVSLLNQQKTLATDTKTADALRDSMSRVMSMALVHHFIYRTNDLENVNMKKYINELVNKLFDTYKEQKHGVKINIELEEIFFDIDQTIPVALIINEIISNTLKYAFTEKNNRIVEISLTKIETHKYRLYISDNGVGFPENFEPLKAKSLGMYLIKNFAKRQLKGTLNIISKPNEGVKYEIEF